MITIDASTTTLLTPTEAALITKFRAPDAEKPVIRPYTPISDEGKCSSIVVLDNLH